MTVRFAFVIFLTSAYALGGCKPKSSDASPACPSDSVSSPCAAHEQWIIATPPGLDKNMAEHAGSELHSALDALWPTLSTDQRAELLAYAGDCSSDGTDGFYGSVQFLLLRSQLEASNLPGVEQLLRGLWEDVIGSTPIEFIVAKRMPEGSRLKAIDLLFDAESSAKCEDARERLETAIRRSLVGVCPEAQTLDMAKLRPLVSGSSGRGRC